MIPRPAAFLASLLTLALAAEAKEPVPPAGGPVPGGSDSHGILAGATIAAVRGAAP
jgi:hypothetical protein